VRAWWSRTFPRLLQTCAALLPMAGVNGGEQVNVLRLALGLTVTPVHFHFHLVRAVFMFQKHVGFGLTVGGYPAASFSLPNSASQFRRF